jgi:predicted dehydrogenase
MNVGVVGCGIIAHHYVEHAAGFPSFAVVACADVDEAVARTFAERHGLRCESVDELIADPEVDIVLNLTPPAAHAALVASTLGAGKHSYTEKPLAVSVDAGRMLLAQAAERGRRVGCAPDTFLGAAYRTAREAIARGDIGEPVHASATMLTGGPEGWHPNADFFYRAGGGPLLDIGPYYLTAMVSLLGPFSSAAGFVSTPTLERVLETGPRAGERFGTEVPTHVTAALQFASGVLGTLTVSFEARGRYESGMLVYGTEGTLSLPDANAFGGDVRIRHTRDEWEDVPYTAEPALETRGIGIHDLVEAVREGRAHRASGDLALHVLETIHAVLRSAEEGRTIDIASREAAAA